MRISSIAGLIGGRAAAPVDAVLAWLDELFSRMRTRRTRDLALAALLLSPALAVLCAFGIGPIFYAIYMSLFDLHYNQGSFIGLGNYQRALSSGDFWNSFLVTVYYVAGAIPAALLLSFVIALLLFRLGRGRGFFRTVYFLPYITSAVAAAMVWRFIFHPQAGLVNALLTAAGLGPQGWLLEPRGVLHLLSGGVISPGVGPSLALFCVILFEIWHGLGFMVVVFLAGLAAVPRELEEAAIIDGAGPVQRVRHVVLPMLSPTVFFLTVVSVIKAFQAFNGFYALTGDGKGPNHTTENLTVFIYSNFYEYGLWGYGAAVATLLTVTIVALTIVQWRFIGRRVHYA